MATQKPISTISYNSESFLKEKLDTWYKAHIIQAYQYIMHKGEDGDKDHIHVRIEPNKKLDPMDLIEDLKEYTKDHKKPLGCRPFRPSVEEDWYLYAVHDEEYLKVKYGGGDKHEKLPYSWEDIKASPDYDVETAFIRAKSKLEHTAQSIAKSLQGGVNPVNLIQQGENVYTVNAIVRALSGSDYTRLASEHENLSREYDRLLMDFQNLVDAVIAEGYNIIKDQDGDYHLEEVEKEVI